MRYGDLVAVMPRLTIVLIVAPSDQRVRNLLVTILDISRAKGVTVAAAAPGSFAASRVCWSIAAEDEAARLAKITEAAKP